MSKKQHRRAPAAQGAARRRPGTPVAPWVVFGLVMLLWATSIVNSYIAKIPGFWAAVEWLRQFAYHRFGFFLFAAVLFGVALAAVFAPVPEISLAGYKVKNPLHLAASDLERRALEEQRRQWEQERRQLTQRADRSAQLERALADAQERVAHLEAQREVAATNTEIYEFALATCSHQDSVLEKLFEAFHQDPAEFAAVYAHAMNWLAHLAKQLVVTQDRSLNCTVMGYDEHTDTAHILGEVGTRPTRTQRFSPKKGVGVAGRAIASGFPQIVTDVYSDPDYVASTRRDDPRSLISVPVFGRGKIIGLVNICSRPPGAFTETDVRTIQLAVDYIAVAMGLARLKAIDRKHTELFKTLDQYLGQESPQEGGEWK